MRLIITAIVALCITSTVQAREHRFLRIYNPIDLEKYADTSGVAVNGYLYLPRPDVQYQARFLSVRIRLLQVKNKLVVVKEKHAKISAVDGKGVFDFVGDLKSEAPLEPGQYVLRVDCHDKLVKGEPMIATQSVFIEVVARR